MMTAFLIFSRSTACFKPSRISVLFFSLTTTTRLTGDRLSHQGGCAGNERVHHDGHSLRSGSEQKAADPADIESSHGREDSDRIAYRRLMQAQCLPNHIGLPERTSAVTPVPEPTV